MPNDPNFVQVVKSSGVRFFKNFRPRHTNQKNKKQVLNFVLQKKKISKS